MMLGVLKIPFIILAGLTFGVSGFDKIYENQPDPVQARYKYIKPGRKTSGNMLWRYQTKSKIDSSPAVSRNNVYIATKKGDVIALQKKYGNLRWRNSLKLKISGSSVELDGKNLYIGTQSGTLVCLDKNSGAAIWQFKADGAIHSAPEVFKNAVFFTSRAGFVYSVNKKMERSYGKEK